MSVCDRFSVPVTGSVALNSPQPVSLRFGLYSSHSVDVGSIVVEKDGVAVGGMGVKVMVSVDDIGNAVGLLLTAELVHAYRKSNPKKIKNRYDLLSFKFLSTP